MRKHMVKSQKQGIAGLDATPFHGLAAHYDNPGTPSWRHQTGGVATSCVVPTTVPKSVQSLPQVSPRSSFSLPISQGPSREF
jgi:hypothetical protein